MSKKSNLPIEVHDHFRKANILHTYVLKDLAEASTHALETGQELLAAKKTIPHGGWETECKRLFDASLRTAQFYMTFAKDMTALPKAQNSAILMLEGTLDGAAKAARKAARPESFSKPGADRSDPAPDAAVGLPGSAGDDVSSADPFEDAPESPPDAQEPETTSGSPRPPKGHQQATGKPDRGKCPVCAGTRWTEDEDGVSCAKCHHPWGEPAGDPDEDRIKTQRQKTVKTVEALVRAFDDLQAMKAKPEHGGATKWTADEVGATLKDMGVIAACKGLLTIAKRW